MGLYEAFKDAISVAQKADNVELYRQLLDLSAQALDMQAEIARLKEENTELRKRRDVASEIIRHDEPCRTLKNDNQNNGYNNYYGQNNMNYNNQKPALNFCNLQSFKPALIF